MTFTLFLEVNNSRLCLMPGIFYFIIFRMPKFEDLQEVVLILNHQKTRTTKRHVWIIYKQWLQVDRLGVNEGNLNERIITIYKSIAPNISA